MGTLRKEICVTGTWRARCAPRVARPGHPVPSSHDGSLPLRAELRRLSVSVPYQSDGLPGKGRRLSARPFELDGGGNRIGSCSPTEGPPAAGSRGETRRVCCRGRPRVGVGGPANWVGQEKRETALCRFPLPAGPRLLPREERLLFLLRLSLYSPSGASSSLAPRFRRA